MQALRARLSYRCWQVLAGKSIATLIHRGSADGVECGELSVERQRRHGAPGVSAGGPNLRAWRAERVKREQFFLLLALISARPGGGPGTLRCRLRHGSLPSCSGHQWAPAAGRLARGTGSLPERRIVPMCAASCAAFLRVSCAATRRPCAACAPVVRRFVRRCMRRMRRAYRDARSGAWLDGPSFEGHDHRPFRSITLSSSMMIQRAARRSLFALRKSRYRAPFCGAVSLASVPGAARSISPRRRHSSSHVPWVVSPRPTALFPIAATRAS